MNFYFQILIIVLAFVLVGAIIYRLHIKNKCDLILTNANVVALDRQYTNELNVVDSILDRFIEKTFDDVLALNLEYAKLTYVKSVEIKEISKVLTNRVGETLSNSMISKLTIIYNKNIIPKIISEKCYMFVLIWSRNINDQKTKNDTIDDTKEDDGMIDFNF